MREIATRGRLPIVTGGTGLYLRALTDGLFAGPVRQEDLRERLKLSTQRHGDAWLHKLLSRNNKIQTFMDARKEKFGYGATNVILK